MKPSLHELAVKYSSDKLHWHSFIPKYEELFAGMDVRRLLEIGIGYKDLMKPFLPADVEYVHGSSLLMWEEYFPDALIYACDIREDALINRGRIRSCVCDQYSPFDLGCLVAEFQPPWDVIIDDGSHQFAHQMFTADVLLEYLSPGGLYVIEDVWDDSYGRALATKLGGELWRGEKGRDDNLVVIRR